MPAVFSATDARATILCVLASTHLSLLLEAGCSSGCLLKTVVVGPSLPLLITAQLRIERELEQDQLLLRSELVISRY